MKKFKTELFFFCISLIIITNVDVAYAQKVKVVSSYGTVNQDVRFDQVKADRTKVKAERAKEHSALLNSRQPQTTRRIALTGNPVSATTV